jgi:hypothetical protein
MYYLLMGKSSGSNVETGGMMNGLPHDIGSDEPGSVFSIIHERYFLIVKRASGNASQYTRLPGV